MNYLEKLTEEGLTLTRDSANNYKTTCGWCDKDNLCINEFTGLWQCFSCNEKGNWNKLAKVYQLELEEVDPLLDYAFSRGISTTTLDEAGVFHENGFICHPAVNPRNPNEVSIHRRSIIGDKRFDWDLNGASATPDLYVPNFNLWKTSDSVFLCEGPWDALSLVELGLNGVANCGVSRTSGYDLLGRFRNIYCAFDNDEAGNNGWRTFTATFPNATRINFPEGIKDVNEWLVSYWRQLKRKPSAGDFLKLTNDGLVRASSLTDQMFTYLDDKDKVLGQPTGLEPLDKLLGGGKRLGELTVTHAHAKTGKNTFWHYLMYLWLEANVPIAYASRELTPETEVIPNILTIKTGINYWKEEISGEAREAARASLGAWPLYFCEGYGTMTFQELEIWIKAAKRHNVQYFWIDHLHYILQDPEDHKEAAKFIKDLKALAKRENVHIDIIVQPNKLMDGQRLSLNSIKGGAAVGQALDNLITLEREPGNKNIVKVGLEVARSKLARPGEFFLQYDAETTSFTEVNEERQPEPPEAGTAEGQLGFPNKQDRTLS